MPLLKGERIADRDLFWHYPHYGNQGGEPSSIVRSGNFKLIHYHEDGRDELYDLTKDIGEGADLAQSNQEKVKVLRAKLDKWLKETGARIPASDDRFNAELKQRQIENASEGQLQGLEKRAANYLKATFVPNKDWWSSLVPKD
jgi:hypothetical protein